MPQSWHLSIFGVPFIETYVLGLIFDLIQCMVSSRLIIVNFVFTDTYVSGPIMYAILNMVASRCFAYLTETYVVRPIIFCCTCLHQI